VLRAANLYISADYPGRVAAHVESECGGLCLFLTGAAGDVDPNEVGSVASLVTMANDLAGAAISSLSAGHVLAEGMRVNSISLNVPSEEFSPDQGLITALLEHELEAIGDLELREKVRGVYKDWAHDVQTLSAEGHQNVVYPLSITVARLDTVVFVFLSGEPLTLLGEQIKKECAPLTTVVIGYTNGCVGYLSPDCEYTRGGYEIAVAHRYYGLPAPIARSSEKAILDAVRNLVES
jgi:hypothetical protein